MILFIGLITAFVVVPAIKMETVSGSSELMFADFRPEQGGGTGSVVANR